MGNEELAKQWARIQEGLLELVDHASALERMMDANPTAALNPARKAMSDALDRRISTARREIAELEKELSESDRRLLNEELVEIRRIRKDKAS